MVSLSKVSIAGTFVLFSSASAGRTSVSQGELTTMKSDFENKCIANKCNQAMWCMPCNPVFDEGCTAAAYLAGGLKIEGKPVGPGFCSEPQAVSNKAKLHGVEYDMNCWGYIQPGWRHTPEADEGAYKAKHSILECREGQITCNNGDCLDWNEAPGKCLKFGFIDNPERTNHKCNLAKQNVMDKVWNAYAGTNFNENYCTKPQQGGIRRLPLRCDRNIGMYPGVAGLCDTIPDGREPAGECVSHRVSAVVGGKGEEEQECSFFCGYNEPPKKIPKCCIPKEGVSVCSTVDLYKPTTSPEYQKCDVDGVQKQRNCGECDNPEFDHCCHKKASQVECTNALGFTSSFERSQCSADVDSASPGVANKVCLTSDPADDPKRLAGGVLVSFNMHPSDPSDSSADCCCSMSCSCFGDPHCTSFYGDYEFTMSNVPVSYYMVEDDEEKFSIKVQNGEPGGIILDAWVKYYDEIEQTEVEIPINSDACAKREGGFEALKGKFYTDYFARENTDDIPEDFFRSIYPPAIFVNAAGYKVEFYCKWQRFQGDYMARLDVVITKSTMDLDVPVQSACCPEQAQVKESFSNKRGFCFREDDGQSDQYFSNLISSQTRRLSAEMSEAEKARKLSAPQTFQNYRSGSIQFAQELNVEPVVLEAVILQVASLTGLPLGSVVADLADGNMDANSLQAFVDQANEVCVKYASNALFAINEETDQCTQGMYLQAKLPAQAEDMWQNVLFFPADVNYCDGELYILYDSVTLEGGEQLNAGYELRFRQCTIDPNNPACGKQWECKESMEVTNIQVKSYLYSNALADALSERLSEAIPRCACHYSEDVIGAKECILKCFSSGDCPGPCV